MVNRLAHQPAPSFPSKSRFPVALVAACLLFTVPSLASASPITYNVNGSATLGGASEVITGSFIYDPTTRKQSATDITLTGPAPYAGLYSDSATATGNGTSISAPSDSLPAVDLVFASQLTTNAADPLSVVIWFSSNGATRVQDLTATGSAVPSSLPEPASFTILGLALGLLPLGRRFSRNRKH